MSRLLVVTSCTGEKAVDSERRLLQADFADDRLDRREAELASHRRRAAEMYTGDQHRLLMEGVRLLRNAFPSLATEVRIISAGYGLLREDDLIVPYEVTFNDMGRREARTWAARRGVPEALDRACDAATVVVWCLGERYLDAVGEPKRRVARQVFFAKPGLEAAVESAAATFVPAGRPEATRYGAGLVALKGKMFWRLARRLAAAGPAGCDEWLRDPSPTRTRALMEAQ